MREIEQTITGLRLNGKRHHYHNQNCVDEMTRGRPFVDCVATPQAVTFTMKKELRAAQQFTPSQTSSSAPRPVVAHSPPPQRQLSSANRVLGSRGSGPIPTNPIEPPQSTSVDDDSPTCAHPIPIAVEEVVVPIKDSPDIEENCQEKDVGRSIAGNKYCRIIKIPILTLRKIFWVVNCHQEKTPRRN
jgi:hypothetical protein